MCAPRYFAFLVLMHGPGRLWFGVVPVRCNPDYPGPRLAMDVQKRHIIEPTVGLLENSDELLSWVG